MPNDRLTKIQALLKKQASKFPDNPTALAHPVVQTHSAQMRGKSVFWKPARLIQRISRSAHIRAWLSTPDSLTAHLRQTCPHLSVRVLSEILERPLADESIALGLPNNDQAWVRTVLLQCGLQNWVYARTVIPNLTSENPWASLQQLGTKPLGEVLFELPSIQRSPFEFSRQALNHWPGLTEQLTAEEVDSPGYARRSIFTQKNAPLLLTEVFLPGLVKR